MLPLMSSSARVAIVGPGNLGTALAAALRSAGIPIQAIVASPRQSSLQKAKALARQVNAKATAQPEEIEAEIVWFCVPDSAIARVAHVFAASGSWRERIALHSSGALTSDELDPLRRKGAVAASVHPLMTFVGRGQSDFSGISFAIEGDSNAIRVARKIVKALRGIAHPIRKQDKAAYHAWGTFASPLLTALLATTEEVGALAGVSRQSARRRMGPILRQTLTNYERFGAARGFSGPIIRGDVETVKRHLRVLRRTPAAREVYIALARAAVSYLPAKNKNALSRLLTRD
ncbi:MAG TPA: Rossmann-like and DUF2520 domain-containing protein [Candidatus Sulfotelmatobacter sp.]|nr:Rossmann-like and DUF2520 domain-containing protein [Candidatus Sulfotelmatobacter sp.]